MCMRRSGCELNVLGIVEGGFSLLLLTVVGVGFRDGDGFEFADFLQLHLKHFPFMMTDGERIMMT